MSRKYNSTKALIVLIISAFTATFVFLRQIARLNLWMDLLKSSGTLFLVFFLIAGLASVLPSEILSVLVIGAIIGFVYFWHRKLALADTKLNASLWKEREFWWRLSGHEFEHEVARVFRYHGFKATVTKGSGDGGADIILEKDGKRIVAQCKHYRQPVPPEPIRALWGIKDDFKADEVLLIASSGITDMGARFIQNKPNFKVMNLDDIIILANKEPLNNKDFSQNQQNIAQTAIKTGRKIDF